VEDAMTEANDEARDINSDDASSVDELEHFTDLHSEETGICHADEEVVSSRKLLWFTFILYFV
jgi:hypothetical protein